MGFGFFYKKKERPFLALDIGTEAVKVLACRKENNKTVIFGASTQYFERYDVFNGRDFGTDLVRKTISKAIEKVEHLPAYLTLPPNILRARIIRQSFQREKPEKEISRDENRAICQQIIREAKKKISSEFAAQFGILPIELEWTNLKILGIKIDGYSVLGLERYEGKNLEFKVLATFLPKYYLENIKRVFEDLELNVSQIIHIAENITALFKNKHTDSVFLDVGGEISQIFLAKKRKLEEILDFGSGGKAFSQELAEALGISEDSARLLKERYSNKLLSVESEKRISGLLSQEKINWYSGLRFKIPSLPVFLFGGGGLVPEIREVFKENGKEAKFIYPKDFENIKDQTEKLKSPQYVPSLLITYGKEIL